MPVKKTSVKAADFEVILTEHEEDSALPGRVQAVFEAAARTKLRVGIAVFRRESSISLQGVRGIAAPPGHSSQAALLLAAAGSNAKHLIFWPERHSPDPGLLRALAAESKRADWVFAPRGRVPFLASLFGKLAGLPLVFDLGAPSVIARDRLALIAPGLAPGEPWIALRLVRSAAMAKLSLGLMPQGTGTLGFMEALGLESALLADRLKTRSYGLACGSALVVSGFMFQSTALLGLALIGLGVWTLAYSFGKAE